MAEGDYQKSSVEEPHQGQALASVALPSLFLHGGPLRPPALSPIDSTRVTMDY